MFDPARRRITGREGGLAPAPSHRLEVCRLEKERGQAHLPDL